jgi:hypothetical protein
MRRCLVVVTRTLSGERLDMEVLRRVREGPCRFHVVVPAMPVPSGTSGDIGPALFAERRLEAALSRLHGMGVLATGEVVDADEAPAVAELLDREHFDDIVCDPPVAV